MHASTKRRQATPAAVSLYCSIGASVRNEKNSEASRLFPKSTPEDREMSNLGCGI